MGRAIRRLGYTDTEASSISSPPIPATSRSANTFKFTDQHHGCIVHHLTSRILKRGHARATAYANNTHVYNLYSRRIYGAIGKDNLRNRRRRSPSRSSTPG